MNENKNSGCLVYILVLVIVIGLFSMCSGGSSDKDRTCAWCNGTGYSGNGATSAVEYVLRKTPCKHCGGDGQY